MIDQELIDKCKVDIDFICDRAIDGNQIDSLASIADNYFELLNNYIKLIEDNAELHKQSAKYKSQLERLIKCSDNNTGYEPSLSVFHREIDVSKSLVEQL